MVRPQRVLRIERMTIKSVLMEQSNKMLCSLRVTAIPEQQKINRYAVKQSVKNRNKILSIVKFEAA